MADMAQSPTAVDPQTQAGIAAFGAPQPNTSFNYAQMQQSNALAQQEQQRLREQAQMDREARREENLATREFAKQNLELQRQQMEQSKQNAAAVQLDAQKQREHEVKIREQEFAMRQTLQNQTLNESRKGQMLEMQFAKSTAEERERMRPLILEQRAKIADLNGKMNALQLIQDGGVKSIADMQKRLTDLHATAEETHKHENDVGSRSANMAMARLYEDAFQANRQALSQYKDRFPRISRKNTIELMPEDIDPTIGVDLLKIVEVGDFDPLMAKVKRNILDIDENAIESRASMMIVNHVARAISQQTGDKISPDGIRNILSELIQAGDKYEDKIGLIGRLKEVGVSPQVIKSALENLGNQIDGTDSKSPFNRQNIFAALKTSVPDSARALGYEATLRLMDKIRHQTSVAATHLPVMNLDTIAKAQEYLARVASGGRYVGSEFAGLIPDMPGMEDDDTLRGLVAGEKMDPRLAKLEAAGMDPFGGYSRQIADYRRQVADLDSLLQSNLSGIGEPSSKIYEDILAELRKEIK